MSDATTPVILSAVRTPIGRYLGGLSSFTAPQLGAMVIREAVKRAGIDAAAVEEVIMGQVVQGGSGQAPARQALIHAGLPGIHSRAHHQQGVRLGSQGGHAGVPGHQGGRRRVHRGGRPGSHVRRAALRVRHEGGIKAGNQTMVDGMIHDGLWDSFGCCHMGEYAEYTADKAGVSRQDQDAYAVESHRKAVAATESGRFKAEILPVQVPGKSGPTTVAADESPRKDTSAETLARLKPAFRKDGAR